MTSPLVSLTCQSAEYCNCQPQCLFEIHLRITILTRMFLSQLKYGSRYYELYNVASLTGWNTAARQINCYLATGKTNNKGLYVVRSVYTAYVEVLSMSFVILSPQDFEAKPLI